MLWVFLLLYFEKENIFTTDSKGEFLLTIMSSLAQEESRSISENVTWGQRKRMADGKVSLAYSRFLGYDKGKGKYEMVVNEEQAVTVRRIFFMFLQGYTAHMTASLLTADRVPTPCGCDTWSGMTVRRILSNEKYKGDALLQKEFTVDFLQKKLKKNEGELPQYYVEKDHEPIISPWLFDYVQKKLNARFEIGNTRYSGVTLFSSKLICGKSRRFYPFKFDEFWKTVYKKRYDSLVDRYDETKAQYDSVAESIAAKEAKSVRLAEFISLMKAQKGVISEFDIGLWSSTVEYVTVDRSKGITVTFRDGTEIKA